MPRGVVSKDKPKSKAKTSALLPIWFDDNGIAQFHVPDELKDLRLGEMLLIQRLCCYVPIVHIRNGTMGLSGHCVCFRQNIRDVAKVLPRRNLPVIKVVRATVNKQGEEKFHTFMIRREKVLRALRWLKKYHKWYREDSDLIIDESALDWMEGKEEAEFTNIQYVEEADNTKFQSTGYVCDLYKQSADDSHDGTCSSSDENFCYTSLALTVPL